MVEAGDGDGADVVVVQGPAGKRRRKSISEDESTETYIAHRLGHDIF